MGTTSATYPRLLGRIALPPRPGVGAKRIRDLPVPVQVVSRRAWGLGPRGVSVLLAMTVHTVWPSAFLYSVGTPDFQLFAAQYPARRFPCQRFAATLAGDAA